MRGRSAEPEISAILPPMPDNILWHVRGQGLIAGQAPARRIRALHMKFATGDCIPLLPQQTAYILQVILAQFGRLAARSCTFRMRSVLSLRGLLIPSSGRRRRWYYGQTAPLMVWYPRAPPSPTLADPMLPIGSDGEHRLWRHGRPRQEETVSSALQAVPRRASASRRQHCGLRPQRSRAVLVHRQAVRQRAR